MRFIRFFNSSGSVLKDVCRNCNGTEVAVRCCHCCKLVTCKKQFLHPSNRCSSFRLLFCSLVIFSVWFLHVSTEACVPINISRLVSDSCIIFLASDPVPFAVYSGEPLKILNLRKYKIPAGHCKLLLLCLWAVPFSSGHSQSSASVLLCPLPPLLSLQLHVLLHCLHKSARWSPAGPQSATSRPSVLLLMDLLSLPCTRSDHLAPASSGFLFKTSSNNMHSLSLSL